MFRRSMIGVSVEDVEKRRLPSKHYVYVIYVTWNDGSLNVIYRRYSRFFELQTKLLDKFPEEAGTKDPTRRIIPFLPGKILFGRSHIREVALKRLESINQYCKTLVKLPSHISECDEVLAFFETSPDDLLEHSKTIEKKPSHRKGKQISHPLLLDQYLAIADYEKQGRNEVSLQTGRKVEVVEKTEIGWWFVSTEEGQGWVPSSHLEKEDGSQEDRVVHEASPGEEERFVVVETYIPMAADEIRIDKGGFVQVVERNLDGWWLVRYQGNEGRVPATNLTKADTLKMNRVTGHVPAPPVEVIPNLMSISNFTRANLDQLVSESSAAANEGSRDKPATNQHSPTKPLIDLNFEPQASSASPPRQGIDENFNPLFRASRRKAPPPRRNSVSAIAPPRPAPPQVEPVYVAIADLTVTVEDGVSLQRGQVLSVLEKTETGWWYVSAGGSRGWAPVSYITKKHQPKKAKSASPRPPRPVKPPSQTAAGSPPVNSSSGLASLAAVLQGVQSKHQAASSSAAVSSTNLTKNQNLNSAGNLQRAAAERSALERKLSTESATSQTDQLYQNVEDSDAFCEVGRYVAAYPFEGVEVGEVRLTAGDLVDVLGRNISGWWYVRVLEGSGQGEGWVPSSFLHAAEEDFESARTSGNSDDTQSTVSGRLGSGIYEEVQNCLYDDMNSLWSGSDPSSSGPSSWSPAHTATRPIIHTTATIEHIPDPITTEDTNTQQEISETTPAGFSERSTSDTKESTSDVARLNTYLRTSFKGQRPTLPKKSKDAENSQQKLAMETKPNVPFLKPVQQKSNSEAEKTEDKPVSAIPSVSSLKPVNSKPVDKFKNSSNSSATEKPILPTKKFPSTAGSKPAVPNTKPGLAVKPAVPTTKPAVPKAKPGVKPQVPGTKPQVRATKPALPQNKPQESRPIPQFGLQKNGNSATKVVRAQGNSAPKQAWPPGQPAENKDRGDTVSQGVRHNGVTSHRNTPSPTTTTTSGVGKSTKVQDLAKLFGQ